MHFITLVEASGDIPSKEIPGGETKPWAKSWLLIYSTLVGDITDASDCCSKNGEPKSEYGESLFCQWTFFVGVVDIVEMNREVFPNLDFPHKRVQCHVIVFSCYHCQQHRHRPRHSQVATWNLKTSRNLTFKKPSGFTSAIKKKEWVQRRREFQKNAHQHKN